MPRSFLLLLVVAGLAFSLACSDSDSDSDSIKVVATTTQIGDLARNVGGDRIDLTVLLRPNQDAHDFAPEPSQIRALNDADVVLRNGIGLDTFVTKDLTGGTDRVTIVTQKVALREATGEHEHGDEDEHEDEDHEEDEAAEAEAAGHDPHVWLDVANAKLMVEAIRDALVAADAPNADFYTENATTYLGQLDTLDNDVRRTIESIPTACRKLVTNHDAMGYFAAAYGLTVVGSVIPSASTNAQPSAADVADIVDKIRAERVPAVFAEASINPALIEQVGREAGVTVVDDIYSDSLGAANSDGGTYVDMMRANSEKIAAALQGCTA